jgi:hypothetical protein
MKSNQEAWAKIVGNRDSVDAEVICIPDKAQVKPFKFLFQFIQQNIGK